MGRTPPVTATRGRGRGTPIARSQSSKQTPLKNREAKRQQETSNAKKRQIPTLVKSAIPIRHSPRVKQINPLQDPGKKIQGSSQNLGQGTGSKAVTGQIKKLHPDGTVKNTESLMDMDAESSTVQPSSPNKRKNVVPPVRVSPRKRVMTSAKEATKVSTGIKIGRRTGEAAFVGKTIRLLPDGTENFDDYWTDPESSNASSNTNENSVSSNKTFAKVPETRKSPRKKPIIPVKDMIKENSSVAKFAVPMTGSLVKERGQSPTMKVSTRPMIGRRTGVDVLAGKVIRLLPDGTENFDDYWTDEEASEGSSMTEPSLVVSTLNNSDESERVMLDKACSAASSLIDVSAVGKESKNDTPVQHSHSARSPLKEREKENEQTKQQSVKLTEYSFSENDTNNTDRISGRIEGKNTTYGLLNDSSSSNIQQNKELVPGKHQYVSPRELLLRKSLNVPRSPINESTVSEDSENEVESNKKQGKKSVSFSFSDVADSFGSSKPKSILFEDSNNVPDTVTSSNTGDMPLRRSPRKIESTSKTAGNKTNIMEEIVNDLALDKAQETKSVSVSEDSGKKGKNVRKVSQNKGPKRMLFEDSAREENSYKAPDIEAPSTSFRSTGEMPLRSSPRKSHNISRSTLNKSNVTEGMQTLDKKQEENAVSLGTKSGKTAKKDRKVSQSKVPKSMVVDDSTSEDNSDNDVPSTSIRNTRDVPSKNVPIRNKNLSKSIKNKSNITQEIENGVEDLEKKSSSLNTDNEKLAKKVFQNKESSLIRSSKHETSLGFILEEDLDNAPEVSDPSTSVKSAGNVSSQSSPKKHPNLPRPIKNKGTIIEDQNNNAEFNQILDKKSSSFRTKIEKPVKKVHKMSKSTIPKSMLIEDSVSEEDSDNVPCNDVPSTSHNVSRSTVNKLQADKKQEVKAFSYLTDKGKSIYKIRKNSVRVKPKSMLIEDSDSEGDSDSVPDNNAPAIQRTVTSPPLRTSPQKINHQSNLTEYPVSNSIPEDTNMDNTSISRRFSPRKNSSKKYHSTPKSPVKINQPVVDENSIENQNAKTVSNMSRNISQIGGAGTSRGISDQVIEEESRVADDSGMSSGTHVSPHDPTSQVSPNNEANSDKRSKTKKLRTKMSSTSRSSRKKSKLVGDVKKKSVDEKAVKTKKSRHKGDKDSRPSKRDKKQLEEVARNSVNESENIAENSGNKNEIASRDSGKEIEATSRDSGNEISPVRDVDGISLQSPSGIQRSPKRKIQASENNSEDSSQENERETVPAKKPKKKKGLPVGDDGPSRENDPNVPSPKAKKKKGSPVEVDDSSQEDNGNVPAAPKVKKSKNKKADYIPREPVRKSEREPIPPLDFWRGERVKTKWINGGKECVSLGVIPGWKEDDGACVALKRMLEARVTKMEQLKMKKKMEKVNMEIPKTKVHDRHKGGDVDVNLHRPFPFTQWSAVGGENGGKVPYYLTKTFSSEKVTFGFLDLCPFEVKSSQYSPQDNIHFVVMKGAVKATIRKTEIEFGKYDSFIVPSTETYAIQNLLKSKSLLHFCTFKLPFFPYQFRDEE